MAFDECTSELADETATEISLERTHQWMLKSLKYYNKAQAIYGIIQGGYYKRLREKATEFIKSLPFNGIAIGGSLGPRIECMYEILDWIIPRLDRDNRPVHLLGIGNINDVFECTSRGMDTFDCVAPARVARRGHLYISPKAGGSIKNKFRIDIEKDTYKDDKNAIDKTCNCKTCKNYSRAYLHHLYKVSINKNIRKNLEDRDLTYYRLATIHNIHFMLSLTKQIREGIKTGTFKKLKQYWLKEKS